MWVVGSRNNNGLQIGLCTASSAPFSKVGQVDSGVKMDGPCSSLGAGMGEGLSGEGRIEKVDLVEVIGLGN